MTTAAVVTASDGVSSGDREDLSGDALETMLRDNGYSVATRTVVPDEREAIAEVLRHLADDKGVDVVVVTGGTGFGPRDVTPEATQDVIGRGAPGLAEVMRAEGRTSTPMADLSRAVAGIRGRTLIVNVPGSPRGATESLVAVLPLLPHAVALLGGDTHDHPAAAAQDGVAAASSPAHDHGHHEADSCALARGVGEQSRSWRLMVINASPVGLYLLHWGGELGFETVLVEPDASRVTGEFGGQADRVVASVAEATPNGETDIVATDHHVADLADHLAQALQSPARSIGLMGSRRHEPPHVMPLRERGFSDEQIGRIQRPIGLDIGSRTPPEIALATLAGLVADRNGRALRTVDTTG